MTLNLIDKIGDYNPQLFREIKGSWKTFNVVIALAISLISQAGVVLYQFGDFPNETYSIHKPFCNLTTAERFNFEQNYLSSVYCPLENIDMQGWWQNCWENIFMALSVMFIFTLLVPGTYLLINNLAQEESRGTFNFLRLSPQSAVSILTGKMLGVPIVLYLTISTALPLHFWSGLSAKIHLSYIFSFYIITTVSCIFFYSAALFFGLISHWFSGFLPWLASFAVLMFLITSIPLTLHGQNVHSTATWLRLLSPFEMMIYLFPRSTNLSSQQLQFFYLPLGASLLGFLSLYLFNYGFGIYWFWQAIKRRFDNPSGTILSKGQSYLLVASYQVVLWGFTLQYVNYPVSYPHNLSSANTYYDVNRQIGENWILIAVFNLLLLFALLAILLPHRQTIQDWARYRHQNFSSSQTARNKSWWHDFIWGEKSPSLVAIMINLLIVTTPLVIWILLAPVLNIHHNDSIDWVNSFGRIKAILAVVFFISLMMIYATLAQIILLMKNPKPSFWAIGIVGAAMFFPPIILGTLGITHDENSLIWLFSTFPWAGMKNSAISSIFMALLAEFSILALLNIRLIKQVKLAGESATKALLTGR